MARRGSRLHKALIPAISIVLLILAIPVTIILLEQRQDLRKHAQFWCSSFPIWVRSSVTGECKYYEDACMVVGDEWHTDDSCNTMGLPGGIGINLPVKVIIPVKVPGIGYDGNNQPRTPRRTMHTVMYDLQGRELKRFDSTALFDGSTFKSQVDLGVGLNAGVYILKTRLDNTLLKYVQENETVMPGITFTVPMVELISGDINNDTNLDLLDYNILISCYGKNTCALKTVSDLDDNGPINGVDYNILLRNFKAQSEAPPDPF